jgi:hypothetical protein
MSTGNIASGGELPATSAPTYQKRLASLRIALLALMFTVMPTSATAKGNSMDQVKQDLARRLSAEYGSMGSFFGSEGVSVEPLSTPFISGGGIFKVTNRGPRVEKISYVGWSGRDFAVFLSGSQSAFNRLLQTVKVQLPSDDVRVAYVRTMLETTANLNFRFQLLKSSADIPDRPQATSDETARIAAVRQRFAAIANGAKIQSLNGSWRVTYHALIVQDLVRLDVDVRPDGGFQVETTVLEKDLAMPYIMG